MDPATIDAFVRAVATLGFPTAAAVFLLWWVTSKLNGRLDRLSDAMEQLPDRLATRIAEKIALLLRSHDEL